MMQKVRTNNQCGVNEDLFFPYVKYSDPEHITTAVLTSPQQILKTEFLGIKKCREYKCPNKKCRVKTNFHPLFIENGLAGCYACDTVIVIVERILSSKKYKLIKIKVKNPKGSYIEFSCTRRHVNEMTYSDLKQGRGCKDCEKDDKKQRIKIELPSKTCDCEKQGLRKTISLCPHYNFAVLCQDAALDWDFCLNELLPNQVSPSSRDEYWFQCGQCYEIYEHSLSARKNGARCPFCSGHRVSKNNNLAMTDPHIAADWDLDTNFKYCNEVTRGCGSDAQWICKIGLEHTYVRKVTTRTSSNQSGCPCQDKTYKQKIGKHEYFVKIASEVHNNKYSYPEEYIKSKVKINIYCPVLGKYDRIPHGNFLQKPGEHKLGRGCPRCAQERDNSRGVGIIKNMLNSLGYIQNKDYFCEQKFENMKYIKSLKLDFFLPNCSIAIEFDGQSHFSVVDGWGGLDGLQKSLDRDYCKDFYCVQNKISMLRFPYMCIDQLNEKRLKNLIELCGTTQVYLSYSHLIEKIKEELILKRVIVLPYD